MTGLETAGAIASIVTTAVTTATLVVLIWYTVETQRLRREAQRQNENSMMPIVIFQSVYVKGQNITVSRPVIRNLGSGPAFNVTIDPITLLGKTMVFEHPRTLAPGQEEYVAISGTREAKRDSAGGYDDGKIHHTQNFLKLLKSSPGGVPTKGVIAYASAAGKKYKTTFAMNSKCDDPESFIVFEGVEAL
jgi:hypothetical protein